MRRVLLRCFSCLGFVVWLAASGTAKPNILVIMSDDMGYGDMGCTGSTTVRTHSLDALAAGVLCRRAYVASSVCSPSRAGFMTGRDPRRFGYEGNLNASADRYATRPELLGLPVSEHTLADHLKALGYQTAIVGKWHLGHAKDFHPNERGFDFFCGMLNGGHTYFPMKGKSHIERNGKLVTDFSSEYLTDFFSDEAIRWMEKSNQVEQPWFLFLSYNAPHTPMQATREDLAACSHIENKKRRTYAAMMRALDRGIGRVVGWLREAQQLDNTLIVFLSDNGGATSNASWNGPLSGAKGTLREGGIRVPMIWHWPERLPPGRLCDQVVSSLDCLPSFVGAAEGQPLPLKPAPSHEDRKNRKRGIQRYGEYDGTDVLSMLANANESNETSRRLFFRLQGQAAILAGDRKLVRLGHRPPESFNVATDPGEQAADATNMGAVQKALFAELGAWESTLPTAPLWDSSPSWWGDSARIYDEWRVRPEP